MTARFRFLHFTPDPFVGSRVAFAAIVDTGAGVAVLPVDRLPGPRCLGSMKAAAALSLAAERLHEVKAFDALPPATGPLVQLGEVNTVPAGVADPVEWVKRHVLPAAEPMAEPASDVVREPLHTQIGYRFFERHRVAPYVRRKFQPARFWSGWVGAEGLDPVSHWVRGKDEVLLMEPVALSRANWLETTRHVSTRLNAYRDALTRAPSNGARLVIYLLRGGEPQNATTAIDVFRSHEHAVVPTWHDEDAAAFLDDIRRIGRSGEPPTLALK